ncbi:hypothetical protein CPLU01_05636 [Colletotrichum plurivorum]|uniref:Uncharacterized protein n=1 Tax=Colletotrichum plurivorum TaxID=2175906 RepID=A0A8H6NHZ5_9PEZI|nr:hypothetical protein CPLU01_05636 [Colletotrichum plurivorum]
MDSTLHSEPRVQKSQLITSIEELQGALLAAQSDADAVETQIAYKDVKINGLKSERMSIVGPAHRYDAFIKAALQEKQMLHDSFDEARDKATVLSGKLNKKKAMLASIAPVESTRTPDPQDNESAAALLEVTATPWKDVFVTSDDGKTFVWPLMLQGVPTAPITEDGPYWEPSWLKFRDTINEEHLQLQHSQDKEERRQKLSHGPLSAEERAEYNSRDKRYQRSMNVAKVAKKWFCPGKTLHPNQMMAKRYLPDIGLCQPYNIYQICNVMSRLNVLYERGEMAMQPIYFLLWRMSVVIERVPQTGIKSFSRSIVEEGHTSMDPILRQAVLRAAQHTNTYNCYGNKRPNRKLVQLQPHTVPKQEDAAHPSTTPITTWDVSHLATILTEMSNARSEEVLAPTKRLDTIATTSADSEKMLSPAKRQDPAPLLGHKRKRSPGPSGQHTSVLAPSELSSIVGPPTKMRRQDFEIPLQHVSLERLVEAGEMAAWAMQAWRDSLTAAQPADHEDRDDSTQSGATQAEPSNDPKNRKHFEPSKNPKNSKHFEPDAHKMPERAATQGLQPFDLNTSAASQTDARRKKERAMQLETNGGGSSAPSQERPDVEITEARPVLKPSPFPRTGRPVSHGFIFEWLPCTEEEAMEGW